MSDTTSTGVLGLDVLTGGGWKLGTINEIWGEPGSGKTTLAKHTLAARHPSARNALWISTAGPIDFKPDPSLAVTCPRNAEHAFDTMMTASGVGASIIVVDDANNLVRQREIAGDPTYMPDEHREFKNELKALKQAVKNSGAVVLFLSQPRDTQRAPIRGTGISEKAADRISLSVMQLKQDKTAIIRARLKSKLAPAHGGADLCAFQVEPGKGINHFRQVLAWGLKSGVIDTSGTWFSFKHPEAAPHGTVTVQGAKQFEEYLREWPSADYGLTNAIRVQFGLGWTTNRYRL